MSEPLRERLASLILRDAQQSIETSEAYWLADAILADGWTPTSAGGQIGAVLAIHHQGMSADGSAWGGELPYPICEADIEEWPCRTVQACENRRPEDD